MKRIIILSIIVFSLSSFSYGAELYSPYFPANQNGDRLVCSVFNTGAKELVGTIEFCGAKGCPTTTCKLIYFPSGSAPKTGEWSQCSAAYDESGAAYCKLTFSGNPRDARAQACILDDVTGDILECAPLE